MVMSSKLSAHVDIILFFICGDELHDHRELRLLALASVALLRCEAIVFLSLVVLCVVHSIRHSVHSRALLRSAQLHM